MWDDEIRNRANSGVNTGGGSIFNNIHNNNNHGINGTADGGGTCINNNHNNHMNQCNGPDKLPPELFAISFSERMRRHSTMSHKIVITEQESIILKRENHSFFSTRKFHRSV